MNFHYILNKKHPELSGYFLLNIYSTTE